jgi:signal transduction histidine kinase
MSDTSLVRAVVDHTGWSLRTRIALLAALIALLSTSVCAVAGTTAINRSLTAHARDSARAVLDDLRRDLDSLASDLGYQVSDYAMWDELYTHLPTPDPQWTRINLVPRRNEGALIAAFALVIDGRIIGRYLPDRIHGAAAENDDPAPAEILIYLAGRGPGTGLAWLNGHPALVSVCAITHSDRSGPSAGTLIGITYFDRRLLDRIERPGWTIQFTQAEQPSEVPSFVTTASRLTAAMALPCRDDNAMQISVVQDQVASDRIGLEANDAIMLGGLASLILASCIGGALGWRWLRPIERLAAACRKRIDDPAYPLPPANDLAEADVLARALDEYADAERQHRNSLAHALDRETTVNAVHLRFLSQLGHEIGDPIHRLVAVINRLAANDGHLPPEEVAAARDNALALEERLHEVLGLAGEIDQRTAPFGERDLAAYLANVVELLRPLAERHQRTLTIDATPGKAMLDTRLLTPVLVNLAANALRAAGNGPVKLSALIADGGGTRWIVSDLGPGIASDLAARIRDACERGEVLPGTPGIGLGLAVALANVRALGGTLQLLRTDDQGTSFAVALPAGSSQRVPPASGTVRLQRSGS